jgi:hypothetical protein
MSLDGPGSSWSQTVAYRAARSGSPAQEHHVGEPSAVHAHDGVATVGDLRERCHLVRALGHHHLEPELLRAANNLVRVPPRVRMT